jgi:tripeptide aminopeptidase
MSLGIPAITIASGSGDRMHSLDEWLEIDKETSMRQLGIAMTTILASAGMRP